MNCNKARFYFPDYADDTIAQGVRAAIESHLAKCDACRLHYETQRQLHQSVKNAAANGLAGVHCQPMLIGPKQFNSVRPASHPALAWRMACAIPALMLLFVIMWPLLRPAPRMINDPNQLRFAEALYYLQMYGADGPGLSRPAAPVVVIIQPGAPARIIELDSTTDISAELR